MRYARYFPLFLILLVPSLAQEKTAAITKEQATKTVRERFKDAVIQESELEKEHGTLIWSFDLKVGKKVHEVWVDATTGKIVKSGEESPAEQRNEAAEAKAEKAALAKVPGMVMATESDTKKGVVIYSFEIKQGNGEVFEVEVDGKTSVVSEVTKKGTEEDEDGDDD